MGRYDFVRRVERIPAALYDAWRGTHLVLYGGRGDAPVLYDVHIPRVLGKTLWSNVTDLTLVGPHIDHNTLYYSMNATLFPRLRRVRMVHMVYWEAWQYRLPPGVVWQFPVETAPGWWHKREVRYSLECGAHATVASFSTTDVLRTHACTDPTGQHGGNNLSTAWVKADDADGPYLMMMASKRIRAHSEIFQPYARFLHAKMAEKGF